MKIKNIILPGIALSMSLFIISCDTSQDKSSDPSPQELAKASVLLKSFGRQISSGSPTPKQRQTIKDLANIPVPVPAFLHENAILASGINFESEEDIVINTVTGEKIDNCRRKYTNNEGLKTAGMKDCKATVIPPNEDIETALNIKSVKGIVKLNNGDGEPKSVEATYSVAVTVIYEGSYCYIRIVAGKQKQVCYDY